MDDATDMLAGDRDWCPGDDWDSSAGMKDTAVPGEKVFLSMKKTRQRSGMHSSCKTQIIGSGSMRRKQSGKIRWVTRPAAVERNDMRRRWEVPEEIRYNPTGDTVGKDGGE